MLGKYQAVRLGLRKITDFSESSTGTSARQPLEYERETHWKERTILCFGCCAGVMILRVYVFAFSWQVKKSRPRWPPRNCRLTAMPVHTQTLLYQLIIKLLI